ncbi:pantoate--beta-alanine ligase [Tessaracoccus sp. ZS01]|uniref:pantoate--beta-alanine ligase n=1 Tax=Tessaracoccus sp. ZS01 TaxID=1906324 RepID=UPI00096E1835|nr:pantoate--beta-alanine ligase [Tessaracoccus sp. ZS01]MCG6567851.1 pantoate--beta-alanine ligase [Tessaracoccus sp. ZS01]OMG55336.1 pantoate--beta-alanine ligase [Tessaracoccus sp. ZS01]
MRIIRTVADLRDALQEARGDGQRVGFVPTMGALHAGHLSLVSAARAACDTVVVSLFVNPTQFNDSADLIAYPRDEGRDAELAAGAGADILFAPDAAEMYPAGFATTVHVRGVSEPLEGAHRGASHFDGVATVVTKLLLAVAPDVAWFGQKDAQQVAVVRRMVADLGLPVRIKTAPTVREADGLAMSSRNVRLAVEDRPRALALKAGLDAVAAEVADGGDTRSAEAAGVAAMRKRGVEPEYLALVDPETFSPASDLQRPSLAVVAAKVGGVRLIDNLPIAPPIHR